VTAELPMASTACAMAMSRLHVYASHVTSPIINLTKPDFSFQAARFSIIMTFSVRLGSRYPGDEVDRDAETVGVGFGGMCNTCRASTIMMPARLIELWTD
jgi:hypothetical protein